MAEERTNIVEGESADNTKPSNHELTWSEIEQVSSAEIDNAIKYTRENISPERQMKWDRYYGKPLGNEVKGKSKYTSRDLLETIEWIMPTLMKTFAAGDSKIILKINGDLQTGEILMDKIHEDLSADNQGTLYTNFYTWFKDALVSGAAFIKMFWEIEYQLEDHVFNNVNAEDLQSMDDDEDIDVKGVKFREDSFAEVEAQITKLRRDDLACENIPHWEFAANRRVKTINDEFGKGQVTVVTMDYLRRVNAQYTEEGEKDFFTGLDELGALTGDPGDAGTDTNNYLGDEKRRYMEYETLIDFTDQKTETGAKALIQLTEWFTRLDLNGDGFLVDCIVWRANGKMIRYEVNEQGFIGIASLSPMIDCYKFYGLAYSDLIIELQNLKTMLLRRILDNWDFQNSGRWLVKPGKNVDTKALLENAPGDAILIDPNNVKDVTPQAFDPRNLMLLEYFDGVKENRTGSTRYNQGTDASSLNQTATGISLIQSASIQRIELIARLMAEGLKDFYHKSAMLYQQNLTEPFQATVKGQKVMISPEQIQGKVIAMVNMGVTAQVGQVEAQKVQQMSATLTEFNKQAPGLFTEREMYNSAAKFIKATGFQVDQYLAPLDQFVQTGKELKENQTQQQQQVLALEDRKLKIEEQQNVIKMKEADTERLKLVQDKDLAILEIASKERIALKKQKN